MAANALHQLFKEGNLLMLLKLCQCNKQRGTKGQGSPPDQLECRSFQSRSGLSGLLLSDTSYDPLPPLLLLYELGPQLRASGVSVVVLSTGCLHNRKQLLLGMRNMRTEASSSRLNSTFEMSVTSVTIECQLQMGRKKLCGAILKRIGWPRGPQLNQKLFLVDPTL